MSKTIVILLIVQAVSCFLFALNLRLREQHDVSFRPVKRACLHIYLVIFALVAIGVIVFGFWIEGWHFGVLMIFMALVFYTASVRPARAILNRLENGHWQSANSAPYPWVVFGFILVELTEVNFKRGGILSPFRVIWNCFRWWATPEDMVAEMKIRAEEDMKDIRRYYYSRQRKLQCGMCGCTPCRCPKYR